MDNEAESVLTEMLRLQKEGAKSNVVRDVLVNFLNAGGRELGEPVFKGFDLTKVDFSGAQLPHARFNDCELSRCNFVGANLANARFVGCNLKSCDFGDSDLSRSTIHAGWEYNKSFAIKFNGAQMYNAELLGTFKRASFDSTDLTRAVLDTCDLRQASFSQTSLEEASMQGVTVDQSTKFKHITKINGMKIDRYSLACLGDDSGLTLGNLMDLDIRDDVAKLRSEFGGFWAFLHVCSLIIFLTPYAHFLGSHYLIAKFLHAEGSETMPLWQALIGFVLTGGRNWQTDWTINWMSFGPFMFYLIYNIARGLLVWKTKKLETRQKVSGLPVRFRLFWEPRWELCYKLVNKMYYVAMIAVLWSTCYFLTIRVPISP